MAKFIVVLEVQVETKLKGEAMAMVTNQVCNNPLLKFIAIPRVIRLPEEERPKNEKGDQKRPQTAADLIKQYNELPGGEQELFKGLFLF